MKEGIFLKSAAILVFIGVFASLLTFVFIRYQKNRAQKVELEKEISMLRNKVEEEKEKITSRNEINPENNAVPIDLNKEPKLNVGDESSPIVLGIYGGEESDNKIKNINSSNEERPINILDVSKWKLYSNNKYKYSFFHPEPFHIGDCSDQSLCKYGQVYEKDNGRSVSVAGINQNQLWSNILITHPEAPEYILPKDKKLIDWMKEKFSGSGLQSIPKDYNFEFKSQKGDPKKAIKITASDSQNGSRYEIFLEIDNKIIQIIMPGAGNKAAKEFYDKWLDKFKVED